MFDIACFPSKPMEFKYIECLRYHEEDPFKVFTPWPHLRVCWYAVCYVSLSSTKKLWTTSGSTQWHLHFGNVYGSLLEMLFPSSGQVSPAVPVAPRSKWNARCVLLRRGELQMSDIVYVTITYPKQIPPILPSFPMKQTPRLEQPLTLRRKNRF